jgi:hypothetical protein
MKRSLILLATLILMLMTHPLQAQFKNPWNIEFTWLTDTTRHSVPLSEITIVLPKGTFPKIDYPDFLGVKEGLKAFFPHEPVISIEIDGQAKAYPLNMLTTHEISNDVLGGIPILATYCPLCNSGVVYDRRLVLGGKAEVLEFEVSGMLRKSDMVMMDTRTESLWQQLMGEAIVGEYSGAFLEVIPSLIISVEEFFNKYPKGLILSNQSSNQSLANSYGNNPYVGYDSDKNKPYERFFNPSELDTRLPAMERVIDIEVNGSYKIYPLTKIAEMGVINDTYKGVPAVLFHSDKTISVLDAREISSSRSIGSVTVFNPIVDGFHYTFEKKRGSFTDHQTGSLWDITGQCYKGKLSGSQLMIIPHSNHFAFAWLAFYPDSEIYE